VIEVSDVHLAFGETDVLAGVDLAVEAGQLVGLVGPNGAGKTTLLGTINGLLEPDTGTVRIDGESVADLGAREVGRRVATVPQETHLAFAFSVEAVVEMGRTPHRSRVDWSAAADAVAAALDRTETTHLRERSVDELSGGERQRVLLARALAQEAPALVLDEPTGSLDVNHQVAVLDLVRRLVDDGRTVVAAIHDLDLAARYCDRLALLHEGRLARVGPPAGVLESATLEAAFDTAAAVTEDAVTATPRVTAVGDRPDRDARVHVVGHGRPAARALGDCWAAGFEVSVGVVPEGDVAATLAADLDLPAVTATPFEAVGPDDRAAVADLVEAAAVVVRAGEALDAATRAALEGVETVVRWPDAATVLDDGRPSRSESPPAAEPTGPAERSVVRAVIEAAAGGTPSDD